MKYQVTYSQAYCTGCLRCQLACSKTYAKCFQPSAARIQLKLSDMKYSAQFSPECMECGFCADSCLFNALSKQPKKASP